MIPECFVIPFIGLKLACDESSSSGFFINDLEGMSFKLAASLGKDWTLKGEELFRRKEKMAIVDTVRDFLMLVQKDYSFKDIMSDQYISGQWGDFVEVDRFGIEIDRCNDTFVAVEVPYFTIFPETVNKITVVIEADGKIIDRIEHTTVANEANVIKIGYKGQHNLVRIYTNLCGERVRPVVSCNCDCHQSCSGCAMLRPITKTGVNWEYNEIYLNQGQVICRCDFDRLVCMYKDKLAPAILYHTGIKLFREFIVTDNITPYIDANKDAAKEMLLIWEGKIDESMVSSGHTIDPRSEYYKSLFTVVEMARNYIKNTKTLCLECKTVQVQSHCLN